MGEIRVSAEQIIHAPADRVYRMIADYRQHHPNFLPPAFSDLKIEEGGVGEGTIFGIKMTAGRRTRQGRFRVTEPESGRVLVENDLNSSAKTIFTVTPEGDHSRVRFDTTWQGAGGIRGVFERLFAPRILRSSYADELGRLDRYAQAHPDA